MVRCYEVNFCCGEVLFQTVSLLCPVKDNRHAIGHFVRYIPKQSRKGLSVICLRLSLPSVVAIPVI